MKVKVSYTMNYDDVPGLVDELHEDCMRRLREHSKMQLNTRNLEKFIQDIKKVQEDILLVNDRLEDCASLALGYEAAKNQGQPSEAPPAGFSESDFVFPPSEDLVDESD